MKVLTGMNIRSASGSSLIELSLTTIVMTFLSTAIFGLLLLTLSNSKKLQNNCDSVNAARGTIEKISKDLRMGRCIGDVYGQMVQVDNDWIVQGTDTFPSNKNPHYGAGQAPPNGWPVWVDNSQPSSFQLSNTTLVVQIPIFDSNGWPLVVPVGSGNPVTTSPQDNVETHIYRVIADPDTTSHPNEYILQWACLPGYNIAGTYDSAAAQKGPITLATSITGPLNSMGQPRIFQFLNKLDTTGTPIDSIPSADINNIANYTGVIVNMEITKHEESAQINSKWQQPGVIALKTEIFLRNNSLATTVGVPASAGP